MAARLLISDANILIDMEAGELLADMFRLDYRFGVPNILYEEELKDRHPELLRYGLSPMGLTPNSIAVVAELIQKYRGFGVSTNDVFALTLARQEQTTLLTGDSRLKQVCLAEGVDVHGTVWLIGEMLEANIIGHADAARAYAGMQAAGSRLPAKDIESQLKKFK